MFSKIKILFLKENSIILKKFPLFSLKNIKFYLILAIFAPKKGKNELKWALLSVFGGFLVGISRYLHVTTRSY